MSGASKHDNNIVIFDIQNVQSEISSLIASRWPEIWDFSEILEFLHSA